MKKKLILHSVTTYYVLVLWRPITLRYLNIFCELEAVASPILASHLNDNSFYL